MRTARRRVLARTLAGLTATFSLAARLGAQTLPVPALPVEPVEPVEIVAAEPRRPAPWDYALGGGVGWDSNIDFLVPDGPRGLALLPRGQIGRKSVSSKIDRRRAAKQARPEDGGQR